MDNQFTDLSIPDINDCYYYAPDLQCRSITYLMKLVLCVNKFSDAIKIIEKILLENPTEINKKNQDGLSALMIACVNSNTHSNIQIVKLLIDSNANVNLTDKYGRSALMYSCRFSNTNSNIQTVKLLIDSNANLNLTNYYERTALMYACMYPNTTSNIQTVKLLIDSDAEADANLVNIDGYSALMYYIRFSDNIDKELLEILICKSNKVITTKNNNNKTAYDYYISKNLNILDNYFLRLLKGETYVPNTKSARSH